MLIEIFKDKEVDMEQGIFTVLEQLTLVLHLETSDMKNTNAKVFELPYQST